MSGRIILAALLWFVLALAGSARAAEQATSVVDPAFRFLGKWEGPANVYDDHQVLRPTNARLNVFRSPDDPRYYVVELTVLDDRLSRFTKCELVNTGEMRLRDEVMVDLRRVKVSGVLKSLNGQRIEEGDVRFFVETPQGDFRPYYSVKLAVRRVQEQPPVSPDATPPTASPEASPKAP